MAIISTYPIDATVTLADKLISWDNVPSAQIQIFKFS